MGKVWIFDGEVGTSGAPVVAGDASPSAVGAVVTDTGASVTYDAAHSRAGKAIHFAGGVSTHHQAYLTTPAGLALPVGGGRAYGFRTAVPGASQSVFKGYEVGGTATSFAVRLDAAGVPQLTNAAGTVIATSQLTAGIVAGGEFRLEWDWACSTGGWALRLFTGTDIENASTSPTASKTGTGDSLGSKVDRARWGNAADNNAGDIWLDAMVIADAPMVGPLGAGDTLAGGGGGGTPDPGTFSWTPNVYYGGGWTPLTAPVA